MQEGYTHSAFHKVHAIVSLVNHRQGALFVLVKEAAPAVEHLFFPVASVLHHTISCLCERYRFLQNGRDFPFQESAFFRPVHTDFHPELRPPCRQDVTDACLGMTVFHDRFHHSFYRPVFHNAYAGYEAARRSVPFIGGAGITASFLFSHQTESSQFFPVAVPVHPPWITIRLHHHQGAGAFPEIFLPVYLVRIQKACFRIDPHTDPVVGIAAGFFYMLFLQIGRISELFIHHCYPCREAVHAGGFQHRVKGYSFAPVQIHVAGFFLHLAFQNLSVPADDRQGIGFTPVLVGKLEIAGKNAFHRIRMRIINQNRIFSFFRLLFSGKQGKKCSALPIV